MLLPYDCHSWGLMIQEDHCHLLPLRLTSENFLSDSYPKAFY